MKLEVNHALSRIKTTERGRRTIIVGCATSKSCKQRTFLNALLFIFIYFYFYIPMLPFAANCHPKAAEDIENVIQGKTK